MTKVMTKKDYVHTILIIFFMFGFGFLPPFGPLTQLGMQILGIFIGCIYGWTIGEMIWPSLLSLIAVGFTDYSTVSAMFTSAFGNQTLLIVLFSLIFCYGIEKSGLLTVVAKYILSRKFAQKGPWLLAFAFWMTCSIAGAVTTNAIPVIVLMWAIFYETASQLDLKPYEAYPSVVLIGCVVCADMGCIVAPYAVNTQICFGVYYAAQPGVTMNFAAYVLLMLIINILTIPLLVLVFKYILRIKVDFKPVSIVDSESITFTARQKIVSLYILVLAIMIIAPNITPDSWKITQILNNLGVVGTFVILIIAMTITTHKGEPFTDVAESMIKTVPWGLYFLLASAMTISSALTAEETGINTLILQLLDPLLANKGPIIFCIIMIYIGMFLTNGINNIVCMTLLIPVSLGFMAANGANPQVLVGIFALVLAQGCVLPGGSVLGAMMHGNTSWLRPVDVIKYAGICVFVIACVCGFIGVPVGNFLFDVLG